MHILLYDPAVIFLQMYSSKIYSYGHQEECTRKSLQNDKSNKKQKHKTPSILEWMNNLWHIYIRDNCTLNKLINYRHAYQYGWI